MDPIFLITMKNAPSNLEGALKHAYLNFSIRFIRQNVLEIIFLLTMWMCTTFRGHLGECNDSSELRGNTSLSASRFGKYCIPQFLWMMTMHLLRRPLNVVRILSTFSHRTSEISNLGFIYFEFLECPKGCFRIGAFFSIKPCKIALWTAFSKAPLRNMFGLKPDKKLDRKSFAFQIRCWWWYISNTQTTMMHFVWFHSGHE